MDASEIYSKGLNAKEVIFPKEKGEFIFQSQMDESNPSGGDQDTENIHFDTGSSKLRRKSP